MSLLSVLTVKRLSAFNGSKTLFGAIRRLSVNKTQIQTRDDSAHHMRWDEFMINYEKAVIGNREIVTFGLNGQPFYTDLPYLPFPAIRYMEPTPEIQALREKERGDWNKLTLDEKKQLYRASFRQTFSEFRAPKSNWMHTIGWLFFFLGLAFWFYAGLRTIVNTPLPYTFRRKYQRAQMRRQILMRNGPIRGLAADWDYDKMDWKDKRWYTPPNPFRPDPCCDDSEQEEESEAN